VAVLGEMYELGDSAPIAHRRVGEQAATACDVLVAVGEELARVVAASAGAAGMNGASVHHVEDAETAADLLRSLLKKNDVVLVKGSRGVGLDRTVDALTTGEAD
jgi:UDP-N-acetylmuramoyl-tripeptide--D-alanyl-D-alanine ligase